MILNWIRSLSSDSCPLVQKVEEDKARKSLLSLEDNHCIKSWIVG